MTLPTPTNRPNTTSIAFLHVTRWLPGVIKNGRKSNRVFIIPTKNIIYIHARFIRNKIYDIGRFKVSNIIFPYHKSKIDSCISRHVCSSTQCHVTQIAQCRVHCQLPSIAKIWEWFLILSGFGGIWCNIAHITSLRSDIELMINTLYPTQQGELWGTICHCFEEKLTILELDRTVQTS